MTPLQRKIVFGTWNWRQEQKRQDMENPEQSPGSQPNSNTKAQKRRQEILGAQGGVQENEITYQNQDWSPDKSLVMDEDEIDVPESVWNPQSMVSEYDMPTGVDPGQ